MPHPTTRQFRSATPAAFVLCALASCAAPKQANTAPAAAPAAPAAAGDDASPAPAVRHVADFKPYVPMSAAQREALLRIGFDGASAMPEYSNAKDRARAQAIVVRGALDADLVDLAAELSMRTAEWRGADAMVLVAERYVKDGKPDKAREFALRAKDSMEQRHEKGELDWAYERVLTGVGIVYLRLGDMDQAGRYLRSTQPGEIARFQTALAQVQSPERFPLQAEAFDKAIAANNFELARGAVEGYLSWLERLPNDDPARRERILSAVSGALPKFPADARERLMERTAEVLAKQADIAGARGWLAQAGTVLAATGLQEEDITPAKCDLAAVRARIGDRDEALADLDAAKRDYLERRFRIQSPFRARSARALAEGYAAVGDLDSAVNCYQSALSDGIVNPNSCPRAEDLAATCASIARSGVPVPDDVQDRIKRIRVDFRDPW